MDWWWIGTLVTILVVMMLFGSMRQYRLKQIIGGRHPWHRSGHRRYVGRPGGYYYGDVSSDWPSWPVWSTYNYWWPSYDCVDIASRKCIGTSDYQSCFNTKLNNCQYGH